MIVGAGPSSAWRLLLLGRLAGAAAASAVEADPALAGFARAGAPAPRVGAPDRLEWERRLRAPTSFGPPPLRDADARLLAAVRAARWGEALQLVKSGQAAANARDDIGGNALVHAARAGQDELARELVRRGAALDLVNDDGFTALGAAAFHGRRSMVRLLVHAGAELERHDASGQTALHLAAMAGQVEVIDDLLRLHADVEMLNRRRETALDVAAVAGQQGAMARLIAAGADASNAGAR